MSLIAWLEGLSRPALETMRQCGTWHPFHEDVRPVPAVTARPSHQGGTLAIPRVPDMGATFTIVELCRSLDAHGLLVGARGDFTRGPITV